MATQYFDYIIVGGGLAGAAAVAAIRQKDGKAAVLLISDEADLPYHRPPLSKALWTGKKRVEDIFVEKDDFYPGAKIAVALNYRAKKIDSRSRKIEDDQGRGYEYRRLLLATGGKPRRLAVPGGELSGVCYFRSLADYKMLRPQVRPGRRAVVIGGGFIGSEMAAALRKNQVEVTMIFPAKYLGGRIFPESLGLALNDYYRRQGVRIISEDAPVSISWNQREWAVATRRGETLAADMVVVGIGIEPETDLAKAAGLALANGIVVNESLQTSDPDIFAAGDNACFPYAALGRPMRVEHWDNALAQGRLAGENMAGADKKYDYLPYFFSDLFDFGFEAVGEVDAALETCADWQEPNQKGVIYYLRDRKVRGVMLCNVWEKLDGARRLIGEGQSFRPADLRGLIRG